MRLRACAVLAIAAILASCGGTGSSPASSAGGEGGGTFRVGVATGQTGYLAGQDGPALKGFQLGVDEINAAGGIDGKTKIVLDIQNTNSDPAQTATTVQKLIGSGAKLIITPCDQDPSVAGGKIAQAAKIPAVSFCASTPTLPGLVGNYMFSNWYGDNVTGYVLGNYARELGYETALLHESPDTAYTLKLPEYFGTAFEAAGGKVVKRVTYAIDQQDFSADVTNIKNLNPQPDVSFTSTYEPQLPAFLQQYRAADIGIKFFAAEGMDTPTILKLPADVINGVVYTTAGFPQPGTPLQAFNDKYKAKYGSDPGSVFPAAGYDLAKIIEAAVKAAGGTDPTKVRDAIAALKDVQGATGPITFAGTNGMPIKTIVLLKIENGKPVLIREEHPDASKLPKP
jgi:branched-chain amino acid transport system substrate-binding protein